MRIFNKEILPQDYSRVARPSVLITVRRWMPKNKRYSVSTWSGWPTDLRVTHGGFMPKSEAVELASRLSLKYKK